MVVKSRVEGIVYNISTVKVKEALYTEVWVEIEIGV